MTLFTNLKICARALLHHRFTRTYVCNVPKNGDRGSLYIHIFLKQRILTQVLVVVGMSGGVDSSVTALLLAKNVCQKIQHIKNLFKMNVYC